VLFFNAFELGAEKWKSSIFERSIKINYFLKITTYHTRPEDDSICKSLLVELKVLPILKTCCGLGTDTLETYINLCSFPTKAFSFLNLIEEKIELKVSIDSSSFPILRF
jgi:hypothetical protein